MGKVSKLRSFRHSKHHDNPQRNRNSVLRRQHSQIVPKTTKTKLGKIGKNTSSERAHAHPPAKVKVPFSPWDRILTVGEGDFSFALSLTQNHEVSCMAATCFDSKAVLEQKYPSVNATIQSFLSGQMAHMTGHSSGTTNPESTAGSETAWNGFSPTPSGDVSSGEESSQPKTDERGEFTVLYSIDATKLSSTHKKALRQQSPFTKIVFNFPHVGGLSTDVNRQVRSNQRLLVDFFNSAKPLLATREDVVGPGSRDHHIFDNPNSSTQYDSLDGGQILVTLFEGEPYSLWNIRDLARHCGLKVLESFRFPWSAYPGYRHARTVGDIVVGKDRSSEGKRKGAWRGEERDARCYVLALNDDGKRSSDPTSRKRKTDDEDSD